jgi:hypothetical protein
LLNINNPSTFPVLIYVTIKLSKEEFKMTAVTSPGKTGRGEGSSIMQWLERHMPSRKSANDISRRVRRIWVVPNVNEELTTHEHFTSVLEYAEPRDMDLERLLNDIPPHVRDDGNVSWYMDNKR